MLDWGQKLYLLRIQKPMTQAELSRRSGIPQANLSRIEKGKQDPAVSTLLKICSALEVSPAEVFKEDLPEPHLAFTRAAIERIASGVFNPSVKLSAGEREIAGLLKDLTPGLRRRRLPAKQIYNTWYELRRRLSSEKIRTLAERIQDEKSRLDARAERDDQELESRLRKILGPGAP